MVTFQTSIELSRRLVAAPRLKEPPVRLVVATLWALYLGSWKRRELALFLSYDLDGRPFVVLFFARLFDRVTRLVGITAVVAEQRYGGPALLGFDLL